MTDRNEWERDVIVWLTGRQAGVSVEALVPADPGLARAMEGFRAWRAAANREAEAARFVEHVRQRIGAFGLGVRRVDRGPEPVRPPVIGSIAGMIGAAREAHAAPLAEVGVAAGSGRELFDEPCDTWVALPADLAAGRYVALPVIGDSMAPLLHSGDVVLVDLDAAVRPGAVAVARHPEHGYVVKRIERVADGQGSLILASLNPAYPPLSFAGGAGSLLGPVVLRWCGHAQAKPPLAPGT
jgi:SOS-response transcriptional repressor LexA